MIEINSVEAIYRNGVFEPLKPVELKEGDHVRLTIQLVQSYSKEELEAWMNRVQARQAEILKRSGVLPDSTADIAADRLR